MGAGVMKLIVGLGNPGPQYEDTRHNIGFRVVELLERRWSLGGWREKFSGWLAEGSVADEKVALLRPMTYMNLSGKAVLAAGRFYKLEIEDLLVISDDMDLPPGRLRIRADGSAGGQRGLGNIIDRLGTRDFARIRIGIGRPGRGDSSSYVLSRWDATDRIWLPDVTEKAADAAEHWIRHGAESAMNEYNRNGARE
jgi:PTH1 family peptidyl-tRNA hydrolase